MSVYITLLYLHESDPFVSWRGGVEIKYQSLLSDFIKLKRKENSDIPLVGNEILSVLHVYIKRNERGVMQVE